jgi:hypothetical protein
VKTAYALFVIVVFLTPTLLKTGLVVNYWLNEHYYAEFLCENKGVKDMHCNGQCALSKELKRAEESKNAAEATLPLVKKLEESSAEMSGQVATLIGWESAPITPRSTFRITAIQAGHRLEMDHPPC